MSSTEEFLNNTLPRIGITVGDAAGIGTEIVLKALSDKTSRDKYQPVIICDARSLRLQADALGVSLDAAADPLEIVDLNNLPGDIRPGEESAETGRASGEYIEKAVELWSDGKIDAIATAPISKKALNAGGYDFPGHTEFLAKLTDSDRFAMSFFAENLRVVLLSTHLSLTDAIARVRKNAIVDLIKFSNEQLARLLNKEVRIAVAGLNPHASEGGMFGTEEADEIAPAVEHCRANLGIDVSGPYSPDTIFLRGYRGEFDAVIACYHDQATIAVKSLSFGSAVNVTLGLPLIRTSVDHGTAPDIAGKNIADASSMTAAIKLAAELATMQQRDFRD
ncbi:MAG TPA: 4-hydroxythreonine-4-phosphate dehydrogenase PdxA [Pyrinomonadaceae bacterium]|nr:4-hydroxythreonine-4-phosphate dehydrogenase PdxA [Pyrinomonadaceae bacterium]